MADVDGVTEEPLGGTISEQGNLQGANGAILSLMFAHGSRPDAAAIAALSSRSGDGARFAVSHAPPDDTGWLELLVNGMTFDLLGLAPAAAAPQPPAGTLLGIGALTECEAVDLLPGPHLAQGRAMVPVVRALADLGAALSVLPGTVAVCWRPSGAWIDPAFFRRIVGDWLNGGAFPALGLVTLHPRPDGALLSLGLSLFTAQELALDPVAGMSTAQTARIAIRLLHDLVGQPPVTEALQLTGPDGEAIALAPRDDGASVRVTIERRR